MEPNLLRVANGVDDNDHNHHDMMDDLEEGSLAVHRGTQMEEKAPPSPPTNPRTGPDHGDCTSVVLPCQTERFCLLGESRVR